MGPDIRAADIAVAVRDGVVPSPASCADWAKTSASQAHRLASAFDEGSAAEVVVFPENLAAGLGLADQTLLLYGLDQDAAARVVTGLRERLNPNSPAPPASERLA